MSTETTDDKPVLYENDHFYITTGLSFRFAGPVDTNGEVEQFPCYKLINKNTSIIEKEGFLFAELLLIAHDSSIVIQRAFAPPEEGEGSKSPTIQ